MLYLCINITLSYVLNDTLTHLSYVLNDTLTHLVVQYLSIIIISIQTCHGIVYVIYASVILFSTCFIFLSQTVVLKILTSMLSKFKRQNKKRKQFTT